ncbi:MAG: methyltransferase domain-containing protein [Planctomycetes bacterium]|jgi:hypothetical protein|nr:methyltransferase domain-containing protein [Planctomycetota bacterium]MCL4729357.1 methyltransferase domain-containing protein [Planctomycetota bacterium]
MNPLARLRNRSRARVAAAQERALASAPSQQELGRMLDAAGTVLDLGSGPSPVRRATAAVDLLIEPGQRAHGAGGRIDPEALAARGIRFVNQSIDRPLPFADGEFEFAYCSHVIEHVEHPGAACDEMMRVARAGLLRCPAATAEYLYGREYHRWLVLQRGPRLLFVEKAEHEYAPFGPSHATAVSDVNPFEAMLDWAGTRPDTGRNRIVARLRRRLQQMFYGREPLSEVNLFWRGGFRWVEIRADGAVAQGGRDGTQWSFDSRGTRRQWPVPV